MVDRDVTRLLDTLPASDNVSPQCAQLDAWASAGQIGRLAELGNALTERQTGNAVWTYGAVLDRVQRLLALTSGPDWARAATELALHELAPPTRPRRMAPLLAQGQPREVLLSLLGGAPAGERRTELGACLLQELVLRGADVHAVAAPWSTRLRAERHPLAALPLTLLPGESRLPLPNYGPTGHSVGMPFGPQETPAPSATGTVSTAQRVTTPEQATALTAAVRTWLESSNGKAEAELFTFTQTPHTVGTATIAALPLACLHGAPEADITLIPATLDEIVAVLFGAAANGGAYDHGHGTAYGRAATWRSMAALTGAAPTIPPADVATLAQQCTWWTLGASSPWFYQVAWDLGIAVLRPDARTLAVLAATDTD